MVNERKTEKLVRDLLEENGYAHKNNIVIEEQASDNPKIDKLLQTVGFLANVPLRAIPWKEYSI